MKKSFAFVIALACLSGCSFYARGKDDYRKAVRNTLDQRSSEIEGCYRAELKGNDAAKGKVVVRFDVAPKTGEFQNAEVVKEETTASEPLQQCVLKNIQDLKLDPADQRKGEATFTWDFSR
jgi:outer membrane biosynthesis protein TonB